MNPVQEITLSPSAHALLGPSGASRWLECTPSARLEEQFPDSSSSAAEEGTIAHALAELKLRLAIGEIAEDLFNAELEKLVASPYYNADMREHTSEYATVVLETFAAAQRATSDAQLFIESRLDLTEYIPEGFGTSDAVIVADDRLEVIDLKYGKGVAVDARENKQMMIYALGALSAHGILYDIKRVRMTIYQPRIGNYSSWECSVEELKKFAKEVVIPKARLAFQGGGDFVSGAHCRFCRAKCRCRAYAEAQLEVAKYEFRAPALLSDAEIADILGRAEAFKNWVSSIEEHALTEARDNGKHFEGFKLVEGRSVRTIINPETCATILMEAGYTEEQIYSRSLLGITALEKAVGKKQFSELLGAHIVKPAGKPTLVPLSDKRPEIGSLSGAVEDFS